MIRSQTECTNALQKLGYQSSGNYWTGALDWEIPSGCSIRNSVDPHLETSPTGLGTGRYDLVPVCTMPLTTGNSSKN